MLASLKLAAGQMWAAWRDYPTVRRSLLEVPAGPPILVSGMYRSGTTWVGAMLAPAGLWHLHEPFNPNRGLWRDELPYADAAYARPEIDDFVATLLRGGHRGALGLPRSDRWYAPLRLLPIEPSRVLIKDPSAALLSEYLVRRHGMQALVLFRHPAAVVGSFLRLDWPTGDLVGRLLTDEQLMDDLLAPMEAWMAESVGGADARSGTILYGCVAHVLWTFLERNPESMVLVSYEDLCRDPKAGFAALLQRLGLPCDDRVHQVHARLTAGGGEEADRAYGVVRRTSEMAGQWRGRVPAADLDAIRKAWDCFDVPLYREPSDWEC